MSAQLERRFAVSPERGSSPGWKSLRMSMAVCGPHGAIELWWSENNKSAVPTFERSGIVAEHRGGVEVHSVKPFEYSREGEGPTFTDCELTPDGTCYCDGSSLYASETVLPMLVGEGSDPVWALLEARYHSQFIQEEVPA